MTTIDYAAPASTTGTGSALYGLRAAFNAPALFLKRHVIALQTRNELYSLSDRQLDDIGLLRADIDDMSREMAARITL